MEDNSTSSEVNGGTGNLNSSDITQESIPKNLSPIFRPVTSAKKLKCFQSHEDEISSFQISRYSKRVSGLSKYQESVIPTSPGSTPSSVRKTIVFPEPVVHTIGTIVKNKNPCVMNNIVEDPKDLSHVSCTYPGVFDNLGMADKDISWVSSMETPAAQQVVQKEFNTFERATLLPEHELKNMQPRALFSPNKNVDIDFKPLKYSSESDDDNEWNNLTKSQDVFDTLVKQSKESTPKGADSTCDREELLSPISPVFKIKTKKTNKNAKKLGQLLVKSPIIVEGSTTFNESVKNQDSSLNISGIKRLEVDKSCGSYFSELSNSIQDDSFQNMSFSCIDELCKNSVAGSEYNTSSNSNLQVIKEEPVSESVLDFAVSKENSISSKFFYNDDKSQELKPILPTDDFLKSAKILEEADNLENISSKGVTNQDFIALKEMINEPLSSWRVKQGSTDSSCKQIQGSIKKQNIDKLQPEIKQFDLNNTQICLTAEYAESLLIKNKETVNIANLSADWETGNDNKQTNTVLSVESNNSVKPVTETSMNSEFPMFATASGKTVTVSNLGVKKVKNMFREELRETDMEMIDCRDETERKHFQGFRTATGVTVKVSEKSLQKVRTLFRDCDVNYDITTVHIDGYVSGESINVSEVKGNRVSEEAVNGTDNILDKRDEFSWDEELREMFSEKPIGFKTASNKAIALSKDSLMKAKALWKGEEKIMEGFDLSEQTSRSHVISIDVNEQKPDELFCGFNTASGKSVAVSEEALKKARNLLREDDKENEIRKTEFCMFRTASKKSVVFPEIALEKVRNIIGEDEVVEGFFGNVAEGQTAAAEKPPEPFMGKAGQEDSSDNAELIPSWLHVYNTSPNLTMDRTFLPAVTSHEDSSKNSTEREEYVIKSPILGVKDRFFNRRRRRKLVFDSSPKTVKLDEDSAKPSFIVPYKRRSGKRSSPDLNIDYGVPFKRPKMDLTVDEITEEVVEGRRKARLQQASRDKKGKVKPTSGSHFLKKMENQMRFCDAVQGAFPEHYDEDTLRRYGVRENVLRMTIYNAPEYRFTATDYYSSAACASNMDGFPVGDECLLILDDDGTAGVEEFTRAFLASPAVEPKLISEQWVRNHYKWIVWKFSHYERSFPHIFGGRCLTPHNVMVQLKYRYDREVDRSHRSALKKILERDEPSTRRIVLCVCDIKKTCDLENSHKDSSSKSLISYKLGVTDGWYSCYAQTDTAMIRLVEEGKVTIGVKLVTQGAELLNCEKGVSPLEASENTHLRIFTNSTRRAKWDSKLGAQKFEGPLRISLNSILPNGGLVGRIDVVIVRVYPVLFMERTPDGSHVTRNSRMEDRAAAVYQRQQEITIEKIYQQARDEMENQTKDNGNVTKKLSLSNIGKISDPEELLKLYERWPDPSVFQSLLTSEQQETIIDYQRRRHEIKNKELMDLVQERIKTEKMNTRKVSQFLRIKIVDFRNPDYRSPAVFTIWNSTEDIARFMSEGKVISIFSAMPSSYRFHKPLQLNSTRLTQYRELSQTVEYPSRKLTRINELAFECEPIFNEVDIVGVVVYIQESCTGSRMSQTIFLADSYFNFVGIIFWSNCKDYGWENTLTVRSVVACSNLQYVKKRNSIPMVYANDSSVFTENPKLNYLKEEIKALKASLTDEKAFISKCQEEIQIKLDDQKNSSNVSRNSADSGQSLQSTVKPKYINGFKTKPSASSTPCKMVSSVFDMSNQEPSPIQKKIEKLKMYGEPPPLSPLLPMDNLEKFRKQFRVPFKNKASLDPSSK